METLFAGRNRLTLADVDSTNTWALELLRSARPVEGTVVLTYNQKQGRGQRGNTWESEPFKNIAASYILYPHFLRPEAQFAITCAVALAVAETIDVLLERSVPVHIKWPNDIFAGGKKICGILVENSIREGQIASSVVGIGINVNQSQFESAPYAVSLAQLAKRTFNLDTVVDELSGFIEKNYLQLRAGKIQQLRDAYHQRMLKIGEEMKFSNEKGNFSAKILGTTNEGLLRLERDGKEEQFNFKTVKFLF
jgi:BirA family biotin operon repressor/biotin-[acetyl-CoA-carboxylase] ligase